MKIAMIGDIVGRPGRLMIKTHLPELRESEQIDFVVANYENASHGFGLTPKSAAELYDSGIDVMTGGNHSFDKKDIIPLMDNPALLRPHNYPETMPGTGLGIYEAGARRVAVLNVMGHYSMPMVDNPFICAQKSVETLHDEGIDTILVDFHAEATSEKRAMLMLLKNRVSAVVGTHTHVATDDLQIDGTTGYVTDMGLAGCRDNVIGMEAKIPLQRFLTGMPGHFNVPNNCKKVLQPVIFEIDDTGKCRQAKRIRIFEDGRTFETEAWIDD